MDTDQGRNEKNNLIQEGAQSEKEMQPENPVDVEGENLADILQDGFKEEPVSDTWDAGYEESSAGEGWDDEYEESSAGGGWNGSGMEDAGEDEAPPRKKRHWGLWITLIVIAAVLIGFYLYVGHYFTTHFQPDTVVGGVECEYMTAEELDEILQSEINQYELRITERGGEEETLRGSDIGIHAVYGDRLEEIIQDQGPYKWLGSIFRDDTDSYDPGKVVEWDEEEFQDAVGNLDCMNTSKMIDPENAEILFSEEDGEYYIKPAEYGTHVKPAAVSEAVADAVASLSESVDLEEADCYEDPNVTESSPEMVATCDEMNQMIAADIVYDMIDIDDIVISKTQLSEWLITDSEGNLAYDEEAIAAFVEDFADQFDTRGKPHTLHTTWGSTVTENVGTYGWQLDQEGEFAQLMEDLAAGEYVRREPVWSHTAASHGENDYGNTYVEVNLTKQHLYFYKNGSLVVDSDFVSGKMTYERVTNEGVYYVYFKQTEAVLKGEDYETPVSYWMPFDGGEGLHDATWRGSFGGTIYMYSGSHGCINLPYSVAETIYNNISVGDCVFVYWEDGLTMELQEDPPTTTTDDSSNTNTSGGTEAVTQDPEADSGDAGGDNGNGSSGSTTGDNSGSSGSGSSGSGNSGSGSSGSGSSGSGSSNSGGSGSTSGGSDNSGSTGGGSDNSGSSGVDPNNPEEPVEPEEPEESEQPEQPEEP